MEKINVVFQKANQYHSNKEYKEAIKIYRKILGQLKLKPKTADRQIKIANVTLNIANSLREDEQYFQANKNYRLSLKIYDDLNDKGYDCRSSISKLYCDWSLLKSSQDDHSSSSKYGAKSLKICKQLINESDKHFYQYLISLYNITNNFQRAKDRDSFIASANEFIDAIDKANNNDPEVAKRYKEIKNKLAFATNTKFNQLRPLEDIKREMELFVRKYKDSIPSSDDAELIMKEFIEICGASIIKTQSRDELEQFYFRIRPKGTMGAKEESQINQFSYPPKDYTNHGRVNLPKYPVFYGGERIEVVAKETNIIDEQEFYLSCWRSNEFRPNYAMIHTAENNSMRLNHHKSLRDKGDIELFNLLPKEYSEKIEYIFNLLTTLFTSKEWGISSAIGYSLLYSKPDIDGIEYLDMKTKTSYNFALKPEAADKLSIMIVYHCKMVDGEIKYLRTGRVIDGKVVFQEYQEKDHPLKLKDVRIIFEEKNAR